jgi:biopolymer transport protein TolR
MTRLSRGAVRFRWRRRRQETARRWPTLNLVALMDVFTILVLFFLVHSGDGSPQLQDELVKLPESVANEPPRDTPVVTITRDNILLEGELVLSLDAPLQDTAGGIEALRSALLAQLATGNSAGSEREITIMGDRSIPFELLNRVMHTCTRAGYGRISLSVQQRSARSG